MLFRCVWITLFLGGFCSALHAQQGMLYGIVTDQEGAPIANAGIFLSNIEKGTSTDSLGRYRITAPAGSLIVEISHVAYQKDTLELRLNPGEQKELNIELTLLDIYLQQVEVYGNMLSEDRIKASSFRLDPLHSQEVISPFNDFNIILLTLPGVVSGNELSSSYSVRGGNFDENLVFVNDIPIYRPLLVRAGQQEGLSFVNPNLVKSVEFYAGGWSSRYGDRMSSVLDIQYKKPEKTAGSLELSLLGGSAHLEKKFGDRLSVVVGVRNKNSRYLLNSLEVDGQYLPNFTDVQGVVNYTLNARPEKRAEIGALFSYAENKYEVIPQSQETNFGFFDFPLRLYVAYGGLEKLQYKTWQSGLYFSKKFNEKIENKTILSGYYSTERERFEVEGAYRLCVLQTNINLPGFDECLSNRGVGSNYRSGANFLDVASATLENKTEIELNHVNAFSLGIGYTTQHFDDSFNEFSFRDSSDYVLINEAFAEDNTLTAHQAFFYIDHRIRPAPNQNLTYGARLHYHSVTGQILVDPRVQYAIKPSGGRDIVYRLSAGIYRQQPFFREFRTREAQLNRDIKAQSSSHVIAGLDYELTFWGRPFKLTGEGYYKYMWNVNPYDIDNVRIRYHSHNNATAYAVGFDMRISGEFVVTDQSWFSLGIMRTRENSGEDGSGYVFRPTDQLINAAIFFQDHIPKFPDYKINVTFFYNSPLPFYTPSADRSQYFRGAEYQRLDIGFSREFNISKNESLLVIGLDVLNLTNSNNVISYSWVQDVTGAYFAVPNRLSQRYFNARVRYRF